MNYRPITDLWILARPKVEYYGAYPSGFLERARALLGVTLDDAVLHVCSGRVRNYPFGGLGPHDRTVDIDPALRPDFVHDCRYSLPPRPDGQHWPAILADPPYTLEDASQYWAGPDVFPQPAALLALCLTYVRPGGRVGFLHYQWPRPPERIGRYAVRAVALVGVITGYGNNLRGYSVFEKLTPSRRR
jgi:hypothetical protein